jgi:hypothetical protein
VSMSTCISTLECSQQRQKKNKKTESLLTETLVTHGLNKSILFACMLASDIFSTPVSSRVSHGHHLCLTDSEFVMKQRSAHGISTGFEWNTSVCVVATYVNYSEIQSFSSGDNHECCHTIIEQNSPANLTQSCLWFHLST